MKKVAGKQILMAVALSFSAAATYGDAVNALAPYDNAQNTAFWNTTERATGANSSASSSATVTVAGTGADAVVLASAFDSRPGTAAVSPARSLRTSKPSGLLISIW